MLVGFDILFESVFIVIIYEIEYLVLPPYIPPVPWGMVGPVYRAGGGARLSLHR